MKLNFFLAVLFMSSIQIVSASEIGIFLLPSEEGDQKIAKIELALKGDFDKERVSYNKASNVRHVSIFQGVFSDTTALKKQVRALARGLKSFGVYIDPNLQDTKENIFLNFKGKAPFQKISESFFQKKIYTLRDSGDLMDQVKRDIRQGVSPENQSLINKYGLYWNVPEKGFNPHFTLVYGSNENDRIAGILKNASVQTFSVQFDRIGIGYLGFDGNVARVIETYELSS